MHSDESFVSLDMEQRDPETFAIIGAAMEVHGELGHGFLENVYHEALCRELSARGIVHQREIHVPVMYKGEPLSCSYRADLICYGSIIVEIKAIRIISGVEQAQVLNYLKASGTQRGLLLNFGSPRLQYERLVWNYEQ